MPEQHELFDTCFGIIESKSSYGIYLILDNNQAAFAYGYTSIPIGTEVCCSIKKPAQGLKRIEVLIDSVFIELVA